MGVVDITMKTEEYKPIRGSDQSKCMSYSRGLNKGGGAYYPDDFGILVVPFLRHVHELVCNSTFSGRSDALSSYSCCVCVLCVKCPGLRSIAILQRTLFRLETNK